MNKINQKILFLSLYAIFFSTKPQTGYPRLANIDTKDTIDILLKTRSIVGLNLNGIRSAGEDLSKIDFSGVKFNDAIFLGTNLMGSDFTNSNLIGANFFGSILIDAKFNGANLNEVQNLHHAIYKKCRTFPWSLIPWWEYDKNTLNVKQISQLLSAGFVICQSNYSDAEIELLSKLKK